MNDQVKINFFASTPEPCSYLDNRKSVSAFANPHMDMDMKTYNELIQHGFRRSGGYIYRPHCPSCQECISVRVPVRKHVYSRNELRAIKRNGDLKINIVPGRFRDQHFDLLTQHLVAIVPEHLLGLLVNQGDLALIINDDHCAARNPYPRFHRKRRRTP